MTGSARTTPVSTPLIAFMPLLAVRRTNFDHSMASTSGVTVASIPAASRVAAKRSARGLIVPSASPNSILASWLLRRTTPGSTMVAEI